MRDVTQLHPRLQALAKQLVSVCLSKGLKIKITDCVRNYEEQEDCVRRGTSSVHYPNSHHNWGTAFDFCRADGRGAYNNSDRFFDKVGRIGEYIGLEWGGSWDSPVDKPHFQLPDWGSTTAKLRGIYGIPDNFRKTWEVEMTQEQFNAMADVYFAEKAKQECSNWAKVDVDTAKEKGITDGSRPKSYATREEVISMIMRKEG